MLFIAQAFGDWLVGYLVEAGRQRLSRWLLGSEQQRAVEDAATAAIDATARQLRPTPTTTDDPRGADHLARVIDQVFQQTPTPEESLAQQATLLQGLQAGVAARLAVLADADITETDQSSAALLELEVSVPELADLLTGHLLRELVARGARGGPLAPLADQLNHDVTHLQGQRHSTSLARLADGLQAALAALSRLEQRPPPTSARPAAPLGRPLRELTDPFALEVHRAIEVDVSPGVVLPVLPLYVEREHDAQLRSIVEQAAGGASVTAVLVGGSSTGKTRACWEAIQALPDTWRLWHPIGPSPPKAVLKELPAMGPRTVLWLDNAQHYLLTTRSELGEQVAAELRSLLHNPSRGPVLVLGTIWQEYWDILTTAPNPPAADPHAQARALLTGTQMRVPAVFSGKDLDTLRAKAARDPRLTQAAAKAEQGQITQFLAGAPALVERYATASDAARALIEAAMDARRLGHGPALPLALLQAAAPGYLTDAQWDLLGEDWLEKALAYTAAPCRGVRGPLTRIRPRPDHPAPPQPSYQLADYLDQTGRATRAAMSIPAALWEALANSGAKDDLVGLAVEAEMRHLYRFAFKLRGAAAYDGDTESFLEAAYMLAAAGRVEEALVWYQREASNGNTEALFEAAYLLADAGRVEEALAWYERAANAGSDTDRHFALIEAARMLAEAGWLEESLAWYERAASTDSDTLVWYFRELTGRFMLGGRPPRGRRGTVMYRPFGNTGSQLALMDAARKLAEAGHIDAALAWYERAADSASSHVLVMYQRAGDDTELLISAARILEQAVAGYEPSADTDYARVWFQRAADTGSQMAILEAARMLAEAGRIDDALAWYSRAADTGNNTLVPMRDRALVVLYPPSDAMPKLPGETVENASYLASREAARMLTKAGRVDEAMGWYLRAARIGGREALAEAAQDVAQAGLAEEALRWLRLVQSKAENGDGEALAAADRLREARWEEAIQAALKPSPEKAQVPTVQNWLDRLAQAGVRVDLIERSRPTSTEEVEEALASFQRAAEHGKTDALTDAARLLQSVGRVEDSLAWYLRAAESGGTGYTEAIDLLEETGRPDDADRLRRYGIQPGGRIADPWG